MADNLEEITNLDESRLYAAMSYLTVLVLVPWLVRRQDPFVNWHIRQGLVVLVAIVLALIATAWWNALGSLLFLLLLIGNVVALVMALQGRKWKIPLLGSVANKFKV